MEERDCCCVRLRVHVLVRVPSSVVLCLCECVRLRASVCLCGVSVSASSEMIEILEVLVFEESAGVMGERCHMFCFTAPRREGLELNS